MSALLLTAIVAVSLLCLGLVFLLGFLAFTIERISAQQADRHELATQQLLEGHQQAMEILKAQNLGEIQALRASDATLRLQAEIARDEYERVITQQAEELHKAGRGAEHFELIGPDEIPEGLDLSKLQEI